MRYEGEINIMLPFKAKNPSGGFKVIYEYANRLSRLGYSVRLLYPLKDPFLSYKLPYFIRYVEAKLFTKRYRPKWFSIYRTVETLIVPEISNKYIPDADIIISTWWSTTLAVGKLSGKKGEKINLIQGFENWDSPDMELLYCSYDIPQSVNITVSTYLKDIVEEHTNNETLVIHNAIEDTSFFIKKKIEVRDPMSVCMMYSEQKIKGSNIGIEALKRVKQKYNNLKVTMFGVVRRPKGLPGWIEYKQKPDNLNSLYNHNAIFLSNSYTEGMALTPLEAVKSGCALVCSDIDGHKEYALQNETALLYEPGNIEELIEKICFLFEHNDKRISLAYNAMEYVKQFSWDNSIKRMNEVIQAKLPRHRKAF